MPPPCSPSPRVAGAAHMAWNRESRYHRLHHEHQSRGGDRLSASALLIMLIMTGRLSIGGYTSAVPAAVAF